MDVKCLFVSLLFKVASAVDVSSGTCSVGDACRVQATALLQQRTDAFRLHGTQQITESPSEDAISKSTEDTAHAKIPKKVIQLSDGATPDTRLMKLWDWMEAALAQMPDRHLEARPVPGQWDHDCSNQQEMSAIASASPRIPRHLHFVLIEERSTWIDQDDPSHLLRAGSPAYSNLEGYEQLLIENMRFSIASHNMTSIHFLDDEACRHATAKWSDDLLRIYEGEADIRFKSDVCRIAALYWEGGYYFDDDMLTYSPVILKDETEIATAEGVNRKAMFQSFLASSPCNPILARNLQLMIEARNGSEVPEAIDVALKEEDGLLGPVTLKLAWDEKQASMGNAQLFHEFRFDPSIHGKLPDRGEHNCEFVVVDEDLKTLHFCSRL